MEDNRRQQYGRPQQGGRPQGQGGRPQGQGGRPGGRGSYNNNQEEKLFSELIALRRVAKATSGAKRLRFSVVLIAGDKKGKIGIAMGKEQIHKKRCKKL